MTEQPKTSDGFGSTPDARAYVDPERYEAERRAIFDREWIALGDAARLAEPGAYLAVAVAGFPIVVVNDDGHLRGYHNVCRHRAGPLVWDGEGRCRSFVCRYHGWAYDLDGSLRSARDFGADPDPAQFSLHPVAVETWRGLLFVHLGPAPTPLAVWLGAVAELCEAYEMESFTPSHRSGHDLAVNWKVYAENYQEGYHIPLVHPGLNRQVDAGRYRVEVRGPAAVHSAPTRDGSVTTGAWLWRFPGFALNLYETGMCLESYWPTGPARTRVEYTFFFAPGTTESEARAAVNSSVAVLEEDRVICEAVQRNLEAGIHGCGVVSPRHEDGVALVAALVDEALATSSPIRPR